MIAQSRPLPDNSPATGNTATAKVDRLAKILRGVFGRLDLCGNAEIGEPYRADAPTPGEVIAAFGADYVRGLMDGGLSIDDIEQLRWCIDAGIHRASRVASNPANGASGIDSSSRVRQLVLDHETRQPQW